MLDAPHAAAISARCLPAATEAGRFPASPGRDAVGRTFAWFDRVFQGDVWRVVCDNPNEVALLLRITPLGYSTPFICSNSFGLIQGSSFVQSS